ncbi:uncharacterized protein LOC131807328 isoform X2 [Mustela lutreola]|uniref:uncharacterized protein LOC131807328 isoform X2 n=1 Tax=Mustela lutreola TaxID=9666 RepID=UPI00279785FE|nr:uncharacterized protein LOC131807328 isoform X2 [Mustela lutreola]
MRRPEAPGGNECPQDRESVPEPAGPQLWAPSPSSPEDRLTLKGQLSKEGQDVQGCSAFKAWDDSSAVHSPAGKARPVPLPKSVYGCTADSVGLETCVPTWVMGMMITPAPAPSPRTSGEREETSLMASSGSTLGSSRPNAVYLVPHGVLRTPHGGDHVTGRQNHQDSKAKPLVPVFPSTTTLFCLLPELWRDDHLSCAPTAPSLRVLTGTLGVPILRSPHTWGWCSRRASQCGSWPVWPRKGSTDPGLKMFPCQGLWGPDLPFRVRGRP